MTPGPGITTLVGGERSHHCAIPAPLISQLYHLITYNVMEDN